MNGLKRALVRGCLRISFRAGHLSGFFHQLPLAFLTSSDLASLNAEYYARPDIVDGWRANGSAGLSAAEEDFVRCYRSSGRRVLVLGCGPGRECVPLARAGFMVTAVDGSESMIRAARDACDAWGFDVAFIRSGLESFALPERSFDLIFLGLNYGGVPERARRVELLRRIARVMAPEARLYVAFMSESTDPVSARTLGSVGFLSRLLGARRRVEPGDRIFGDGEFHRCFASAEEVGQEAAEAGFRIDAANGEGNALYLAAAGAADPVVAASNLRLYREAGILCERFREKRIPFLFLKGIYLAQEFYPDISCRPMTDIDVLIRAEDVVRSGAILKEMGYGSLGDIEAALARPGAYAVTFQRRDKGQGAIFTVDVHWHFLTATWLRRLLSDRFDMNAIFGRAVAFSLEGHLEAFALSEDDHIVFLAQHCFSHGFDKPMMLEDIRRMWGRVGTDAARRDIRDRARRWGLAEVLDFTLWFAFSEAGGGIAARFSFGIARSLRLYRSPCVLFLLIQERGAGVPGYIGKLAFSGWPKRTQPVDF